MHQVTTTHWQWSDRSSATSLLAEIMSAIPADERVLIVEEALELSNRNDLLQEGSFDTCDNCGKEHYHTHYDLECHGGDIICDGCNQPTQKQF